MANSSLMECISAVGFIGIAFITIFLLVPVIWRYSHSFQKRMLFMNYGHLPAVRNYKNPVVYGLDGTRNFYIDTNDNVTLGVWHILPRNLIEICEEEQSNYEKLLSHGETIIIYMHGNSGTRANEQRVELYHKLQDMDCHVVAVDYRSYADSTSAVIDEAGLVSDAMETFKWVYERANGTPIFVWGHSLGTGISAHAISLLEKENIYPNGFILEAPFAKMSHAVRDYSPIKGFQNFPGFDFFIIDPVIKNGIIFDTEQNLKNTKVPLLILHAKDDTMIPYQQSEQLFDYITRIRNEKVLTKLVLYDAKYRFGHKLIYQDDDLKNKVKKFMENCLNTTS